MRPVDLAALRQAAREDRYLISRHAQERMGLRKITHADLKYVVATGDVVEASRQPARSEGLVYGARPRRTAVRLLRL